MIYALWVIIEKSKDSAMNTGNYTEFDHEGFNQLQQATKNRRISELVFSGGGVRGASYVGVYQALYEAGLFEGINTISGSSIGALSAGFIATGMKPDQFQQAAMQMNESLLGGRSSFFSIARTGQPMLDFCRQKIRQNIQNFFQENIGVLSDVKLGTRNILYLKHLYQRNKRSQPIYFKDLQRLHRLFPKRFKKVVLTAVARECGEVKRFSIETTPYVEIASAIRASASLPVILQPHNVNGREYIDGGYYENIPTEALEPVEKAHLDTHPSVKEKSKLNRLIFAFSERQNDPVHKALYGRQEKLYDPGIISKFIYNKLVRYLCDIGASRNGTDAAEEEYQRLRGKYALQTIKIDTGVDSIDFKKGESQKLQLYFQGYFSTKRYLMNHGLVKESPHFLFREFAFELFNSYSTQPSWFSPFKTDPAKSRKATLLLSFCNDSKKSLSTKNMDFLVSNFIYLCAIDRRTGEFKANTRLAKLLLEKLNHPTTNTAIKTQFIRMLTGKTCQGNEVSLFQFNATHLAQFISGYSTRRKGKSIFYETFLSNKTGQVRRKLLSCQSI